MSAQLLEFSGFVDDWEKKSFMYHLHPETLNEPQPMDAAQLLDAPLTFHAPLHELIEPSELNKYVELLAPVEPKASLKPNASVEPRNISPSKKIQKSNQHRGIENKENAGPKLSYTLIIAMVLIDLTAKEKVKRVIVERIHDGIRELFPHTTKTASWKNSVRHALISGVNFEKTMKADSNEGRQSMTRFEWGLTTNLKVRDKLNTRIRKWLKYSADKVLKDRILSKLENE